MFKNFISLYPPSSNLIKPFSQLYLELEEEVPSELLSFWRDYGFGNYGGGLIKVINPIEYEDIMIDWLDSYGKYYPILMTAFGNLVISYKKIDNTYGLSYLDIHTKSFFNFQMSFSEFIEYLTSNEFQTKYLNKPLFNEALFFKNGLNFNEVFFFKQPLLLGGTESIDNIDKGKVSDVFNRLIEIQRDLDRNIIYDAEPNIVETDEGDIFADFVIIAGYKLALPLHPELLYEYNGEVIYDWSVSFINEEECKNFGVIDYYEALELLEPYIIERRENSVVIKALSNDEIIELLDAEDLDESLDFEDFE